MPTSRTSVASVVSANRLYVLGGISDAGILDICEVYDPAGDNWTQIASLPAPRAYASAVEHQGKVFMLGGETSQDQLAIVESYDPSTNTWSQLTPLPSPRSRFGQAFSTARFMSSEDISAMALFMRMTFRVTNGNWLELYPNRRMA